MPERQAIAVYYRAHGMKFKEIGKNLGVTVNRARFLFEHGMAKYIDRNENPMSVFSTRTRNCLISAGYTSPDEVESALKHGDRRTFLRIKHLGLKSFKEICERFGVNPSPKPKHPTLSIAEAIDFLKANGYDVRKKQSSKK
jgi:hypothetical protein